MTIRGTTPKSITSIRLIAHVLRRRVESYIEGTTLQPGRLATLKRRAKLAPDALNVFRHSASVEGEVWALARKPPDETFINVLD